MRDVFNVATGRPKTNGAELSQETIIACAEELKTLAEALVIFENFVCNMTPDGKFSSAEIKSLQDLDRIQQTMIALSNVLDSIGAQHRLDRILQDIPLASLRSRLQNRAMLKPSDSGDLSIF